MKFNIIITLLFALGMGSFSYAQTDTVSASYKYVMGDNDTKSDARNLCFLNAKKLCLEKAGTFVKSQLSLKKSEIQRNDNFDYSEVTQQDIQTFTGAFVKAEVVNEELSYVGETIAISMTVRAIVNSNNILDQIVAVKEDEGLSKRIKAQQDQLIAMESKIKELQVTLNNTTTDLTKPARVERIEVFSKMSELEKIKYEINQRTKMAVDYVELGMTPEEVEKLIGQPRSIAREYPLAEPEFFSYNYGRVWVVFEESIVSCIVRADNFDKSLRRSSFDRNDLIK